MKIYFWVYSLLPNCIHVEMHMTEMLKDRCLVNVDKSDRTVECQTEVGLERLVGNSY